MSCTGAVTPDILKSVAVVENCSKHYKRIALREAVKSHSLTKMFSDNFGNDATFFRTPALRHILQYFIRVARVQTALV